jgi:hypothetical protein
MSPEQMIASNGLRTQPFEHSTYLRVMVKRTRAFSSEVATGSREENASQQESGASVLIQSEPNML